MVIPALPTSAPPDQTEALIGRHQRFLGGMFKKTVCSAGLYDGPRKKRYEKRVLWASFEQCSRSFDIQTGFIKQ